MNRNVIVVSGDPKGHFIEGTLGSGVAPKPGTCLQVKDGATLVQGRPQYELWNGKPEVIIVRENDLMGQGVDTAYPTAGHFFGYIPMPGDEVQVRMKDISGTADNFTAGESVAIEATSGKGIAGVGTANFQTVFTSLENVTGVAAEGLLLCRFNGLN